MSSTQLQITAVDFSELTQGALSEICNDTDFCDVTLVCDGDQQIKAHKVVLASFSQFFKNILAKNPHEHPLLYIKGINLESLKSILAFIYSGEVTTDQHSLDSFLQLSKDLEIRGLFEGHSFTGNIAGQQKNENWLFVEKDSRGELMEIKPDPNQTISESTGVTDQETKKHIKGKTRRYQYHLCDQCEFTATIRSLIRHKSEAHENHNVNGGDGFSAKDIMENMPGIETEPIITVPETALVPDQDDGKPIISKKERCHRCDKCEYSATNAGVLSRHKKTTHTNQFFNCEQCNYTTNRDDNFLRHNRTMHN